MLPSLPELRLRSCELLNVPHSAPNINFTSFSILDLSDNNFNSSIPQWLFNLCTHLDLGLFNSYMKAPVSDIPWGNLCNLRTLDLVKNQIGGDIDELIGDLVECNNNSLEELRRRKLANLNVLSLDNNYWEGALSQNHLQGLTKLQSFRISSSNKSLIFNMSHESVTPFSLIDITVQNCRLGPRFPVWPSNQKQLSSIRLTDVAISETIPYWLLELSP
ncbi:hypothetical protein ACSBR2_036391 [Camellia fascicularis]